jgi:hypothetical protein
MEYTDIRPSRAHDTIRVASRLKCTAVTKSRWACKVFKHRATKNTSRPLSMGERANVLTFRDVPYPNIAFATSRDEKVGRCIIVNAKNVARVAFQGFRGQSLNPCIMRELRDKSRRGRRTESTCHIRMVVSSDADARYTLSDDHAISDRPAVCPFKFRINFPVNGDHILTALSAPEKVDD